MFVSDQQSDEHCVVVILDPVTFLLSRDVLCVQIDACANKIEDCIDIDCSYVTNLLPDSSIISGRLHFAHSSLVLGH